MGSPPLSILVLCTGNSARSILGEVLINELGAGRFIARSAGSQPTGEVNPGTLRILKRHGHSTASLESKSWERFSGADAPLFDIVITVCDNAAGESCPLWNGSPVTVHWGIADPAIVEAEHSEAAFEQAYIGLRRRIELMLELPLSDFDVRTRQESLARIHDSLIVHTRS